MPSFSSCPEPGPARIVFFVPLLLLLNGCLMGPDYERPDVSEQLPESFSVPEGWKLAEPSDDQPRGEWWKHFKSPALDDLIMQAHERNQDLTAAVYRMEQARAIVDGSRAAFLPTLDFAPSFERRRRSGTINNAAANLTGTKTSNLSMPVLLGYEFDFWGGLRRAVEAAEAESLGGEATLRQARLSLEAEVATLYFTLRSLDSEIGILMEAVELRERALDLNRKRFVAGDTDEVDVTRAQTELATTEVELIDVRQSRDMVENAIAVLVGEPASGFNLPSEMLGDPPSNAPVAAPAGLLERRPDVAAAERDMMAANARIGVAKAAFYPSVRISATGGLESGGTARLFDLASRTWGFGPEVSLPILDGGRNRAELKRVRARHEETVARYRQTVLNAVRDVEDALTDLARLKEKTIAQDRTVTAAARTVELSRRRYEAGVVAYFEVVDAQRTELDSRRLALEFKAARHLATIALIRALGGDWSEPVEKGE